MNPMDGILAFLLLSSTIYLQPVHSCEIYRFVASDGPLALDGHVIKTITKSIVNLCWAECVWLPWCFSLNVRQTSGGMFECELNNSSKRAAPNKTVTRQGWTYHEMKNVSEANQKLYPLNSKWKEDLGNGWRRYGNSAFKLFQEKKNWTEARSHCQSLGGDLASITSSHENDFLYEVLVEKLNLTYVDHGIYLPYNYVHWKLNGEEPFVELLGPPGDAQYEFVDGEKALFLNGNKGYAQMPAQALQPDAFQIAFWINISLVKENLVTVLHIFNNESKLIEFYADTVKNRMYLRVKNVDIYVVRYKRNVWQHFGIAWVKGPQIIRYAYQGKWKNHTRASFSDLVITGDEQIRLGAQSPSYLDSHMALRGHIKHLVFANTTVHHHSGMQYFMYLNKQGVWIGMNNTNNTDKFAWSDGTPVQFMASMPPYWHAQPTRSGRKCIAMAENRKWLDKQCRQMFPFICEKPAPP